MNFPRFILTIPVSYSYVHTFRTWLLQNHIWILLSVLIAISFSYFAHFYLNGLGIAYNDARSHLDIGRRVVEGLTPGFAQIGSVWLPLPHILMIPTIWNDFMWHSGLAGSLQSMLAFVGTAFLVYAFSRQIKAGMFGALVAVAIFVANLNILYLQATAMTELLLLFTIMSSLYYLYVWHKSDEIRHLILAAVCIMATTLIRYEGWFLLFYASVLVIVQTYRRFAYKKTEGTYLLFATLAGFGIVLWVGWNWLIFGDPFYFAFGPFSAHAQQQQLETAGVLSTKGNLWLSVKMYTYALLYNSWGLAPILAAVGLGLFWNDRRFSISQRFASTALLTPLFFNVLALYLGHSVLFIQGVSGNTWFNVRYGIMLAPMISVCIGYLTARVKAYRWVIVSLLLFVSFYGFINQDAVTIDDARVGSSQKNVTEVSSWLAQHAGPEEEFILISVASHDAIIFSSGLPMKRFIHEGTDAYWKAAVVSPDQWARWIIMRTYDDGDLTYRLVKNSPGLTYYQLVGEFPFADIYELKPEYAQKLAPTSTLIARHKKG